MTSSEHLQLLEKIYRKTAQHSSVVDAYFTGGVRRSDHTEYVYNMNKRVSWMATLCVVARKHYDAIIALDPVTPSIVEPAERLYLAVHAMANAALHYFRAYTVTIPNGLSIYLTTYDRLVGRINNTK